MRPPNWHHFKKVLLNLGYDLVPRKQRGFLYFRHDKMRTVVPEKMNDYDDLHMNKYLSVMKLPRPFFKAVYKNCCKM